MRKIARVFSKRKRIASSDGVCDLNDHLAGCISSCEGTNDAIPSIKKRAQRKRCATEAEVRACISTLAGFRIICE